MGISDNIGAAIVVQSMVHGNLNSRSGASLSISKSISYFNIYLGTGVVFSRNPSTGENKIYGEVKCKICIKYSNCSAVFSFFLSPLAKMF